MSNENEKEPTDDLSKEELKQESQDDSKEDSVETSMGEPSETENSEDLVEKQSEEENKDPNTKEAPEKEPVQEKQLIEENVSESSEESAEETPKTPQIPEVEVENWEDALNQKSPKKKKKSQFKAKLKEKQLELENKTVEVIDQQFSKIFDRKILVYTIIFLIAAIVIGILTSFSEEGANQQINFWQIALTLMVMLGYLFLLLLSRIPSMEKHLFGETRQSDIIKIVLTVVGFVVGLVLCWLYWTYLDPQIGDTVSYLRFKELFGLALAVIFFGWNIIQIIFLKNSLENASIGLEARYEVSAEMNPQKNNARKAAIVNIICLILPFVYLFLFTWIYIYLDTPASQDNWYHLFGQDTPTWALGLTQKFTNESFYFSDYLETLFEDAEQNSVVITDSGFVIFFKNYLPDVWFANDALKGIFVWGIIVVIIMIATTIHQAKLNTECKKNETRNIFSGIFYALFWLVLWIKLFLIIKTYISTLASVEVNLMWYDQLFDWITSIVLMLITIVNVLRSVGLKMQNVKRSWLNAYNITFIMFVFVISYWGGQWTLITGEAFASQQSLSIGTNIAVVVVNVAYYYWYSRWILERRGFMRKSSFTMAETKHMLIELSQRINGGLLQTIENREVITGTLNTYLIEKKIALKKAGIGEDGIIESLEEKEVEKSIEEKLKFAQIAVREARIEKNAYETALQKLSELEQKLEQEKQNFIKAEQEVKDLPADIDSNYENITREKASAEGKRDSIKNEIVRIKNEVQNLNIPSKPTNNESIDQEEMAKIEQEIEEKLKTKGELEQKLAELESDLASDQIEFEKIQNKWEEAKNRFENAESVRNIVQNSEVKVNSIETAITALKVDIETLKERAESSQPLLDASENLEKASQEEDEAKKALDSAKKQEKDADEKLKLANEIHNQTSQKVKDAKDVLSTRKIIAEIEKDIQKSKERVKNAETQIKEAESTLSQKNKVLNEKKAIFEAARTKTEEAKAKLTEVEKALSAARSKLENSRQTLKNGQNNHQKLEEEKKALKKAEKAQSDIKSVAQAEDDIKVAQSKLKKYKGDLKTLKKNDPGDGSVDEEIRDLTDKINDLEATHEDYKLELKEAKSAQNSVSNLKKQVKQLEDQQVDLEQAEKTVKANEKAVEIAEKAIDAPQKDHEEKLALKNDAENDFTAVQNEVKEAENDVNAANLEFQNATDELKNNEKALQDRKDAETALANSEVELAKENKILEKAQENFDSMRKIREEAEKTYAISVENSTLDYEIYKAEKALKKAHKTFKEAIRSAQANVVSCESAVKIAKEHKEAILQARNQPIELEE